MRWLLVLDVRVRREGRRPKGDARRVRKLLFQSGCAMSEILECSRGRRRRAQGQRHQKKQSRGHKARDTKDRRDQRFDRWPDPGFKWAGSGMNLGCVCGRVLGLGFVAELEQRAIDQVSWERLDGCYFFVGGQERIRECTAFDELIGRGFKQGRCRNAGQCDDEGEDENEVGARGEGDPDLEVKDIDERNQRETRQEELLPESQIRNRRHALPLRPSAKAGCDPDSYHDGTSQRKRHGRWATGTTD